MRVLEQSNSLWPSLPVADATTTVAKYVLCRLLVSLPISSSTLIVFTRIQGWIHWLVNSHRGRFNAHLYILFLTPYVSSLSTRDQAAAGKRNFEDSGHAPAICNPSPCAVIFFIALQLHINAVAHVHRVSTTISAQVWVRCGTRHRIRLLWI